MKKDKLPAWAGKSPAAAILADKLMSTWGFSKLGNLRYVFKRAQTHPEGPLILALMAEAGLVPDPPSQREQEFKRRVHLLLEEGVNLGFYPGDHTERQWLEEVFKGLGWRRKKGRHASARWAPPAGSGWVEVYHWAMSRGHAR